MSFTYDLATDIGKVRLEIGDTVDGTGVKPDGTNFADEEIQHLVTREGSFGAASAACCEILARMWAKYAGSQSAGPRSESFQQSTAFKEMAQDLRAQYGGGGSGAITAGVLALDFMEKDASDTTILDSDEL